MGRLEQSVREQAAEVELIKGEIAELESKLSSVRDQVLRDALLVACTCAKSTLDKVVAARQFDTVAIDESSMVSLPQTLWCSSLAKERFLCFGDFRQLPPISAIRQQDDPVNYEVMHSSVFEHNRIGLSDEAWLDDYRLHMLSEQRRMPSQVCDLVSEAMYRGRLHTHPAAPQVDAPLTLVSTSRFNAWSDKTEAFSWFNWHHAFVVVELVRQLQSKLGGDDRKVLILSPFRAQVEVIRALLEEARLNEVARVSTVWRSQGTEEDIVIFDTVCAPPFTQPGRWFRDEPGPADGARLLNVALTRTKRELYLIAHADYLRRRCPPKSFAARILSAFERDAIIRDSRELTRESLAASPNGRGGFPMLTFSGADAALFSEESFLTAFAADLDLMPRASTVTIFSPFLSEKSVAHWGGRLRVAIDRGCRVQIITRKRSQQNLFQSVAQVEALIGELEALGAAVGFDNYVPGQKPDHRKIAILRFPEDSRDPVTWMGSMNVLGYYSSEELMLRFQSRKFYDCLAGLVKLGQLQAALAGKDLATEMEAQVQHLLGAICELCGSPMRLKLARRAKYKGFFISCQRWREGCQNTRNVDTDTLNQALAATNARCTKDDCESRVDARRGRAGVYLKCSKGHFVNLPL